VIVRLTPPARAQLLAAIAYIDADRPTAARDFRTRVEGALRRLIDFPESGRIIPEFGRLGFREVLVDSYRLFYRLQGDVIWVVGVWHDAQIPNEPVEPGGV
jgi:plasmid stabilization system protein ParE